MLLLMRNELKVWWISSACAPGLLKFIGELLPSVDKARNLRKKYRAVFPAPLLFKEGGTRSVTGRSFSAALPQCCEGKVTGVTLLQGGTTLHLLQKCSTNVSNVAVVSKITHFPLAPLLGG